MRIPRIYTPEQLAVGICIDLDENAARHVTAALRMTAGQQLILFNGLGGEFSAELVTAKKNKASVMVTAFSDCERESALQLHLGIGISRGERMDWVVQKSTELGVNSVTPLSTKHTGVKLAGDRADKKIHHWQKIAISACEQCGRNRTPVIHPLETLDNWLASTLAECRYVLHHRADIDAERREPPASIALLIGPEGGLDDSEIFAAEQAGYSSLGLGPRVLRTETAPLAAIAILQGRWGDMQSH